MLPGRMMVEGVAGHLEADILRKLDRQIAFRHRDNAAPAAMDQRDRTAPIALTRDPPIAQPIDCGGLAATQRFEPLGCGPSRLGDGEAVEKGGIEDRAVLDK